MSTKELHAVGEFRAYPSNLEVLTPDGVATVSLDGLVHTMTPSEAREHAEEEADRIGIPSDCAGRGCLVGYIASRCDATGAPDYAGPYYVARIRSYYGPREEVTLVNDGQSFSPEPFATVGEALEAIAYFEAGRYELSHNEASRPEYVVVDQAAANWLDLDDCGKYDWDKCGCTEGLGGEPCGVCNECYAFMRDQDIAYVRAHAAEDGEDGE